MSLIVYYPTIPNPPDAPNNDVVRMQTNSGSLGTIWEVNHIGFNADSGGTHTTLQFNQFSGGALPSGDADASVAYPAAGKADVSRAQLNFKNSQTNFILSGVRCYALCTGLTGAIVGTQSQNCTVSRSSIGEYIVTITNNAVVDPDYGVFVQVINPTIYFWLIEKTGVNQFKINVFNNGFALRDPTQFCFQVYQL